MFKDAQSFVEWELLQLWLISKIECHKQLVNLAYINLLEKLSIQLIILFQIVLLNWGLFITLIIQI